MDFIGFTYNGYHSVRDLKIYRTSNGSRYDENLTATMVDKTVDVPGGDGQYYFGTNFKNKTFNIQYAFDELDEAGLALLKKVFSGDGIHDLVFDEAPYKVWGAKVTGTAQIKHLCFTDDNGNRVYKGEGSITFTCYYPYAHTPKELGFSNGSNIIYIEIGTTFPCDLLVYENSIQSAFPCRIHTKTLSEDGHWSESELYYDAEESKSYTGILTIITSIIPLYAEYQYNTMTIQINGEQYDYTTNNCWEPHGDRDGRNINHYPSILYPNKMEWFEASGLRQTPKNGSNYGELPAPFIFERSGDISVDTKIELSGVATIKIKENCSNLKWDSKTGIVTGTVADGSTRPIRYTGNSIAQLPVGENNISLGSNDKLTYDYWYR